MTDFEKLLGLALPADAAPVLVKLAAAYELSGDVQGVHLRATLHKLLEKHKANGLAYNDARNNKTYASIDADDVTRTRILGDLNAYLLKQPKVRQYNLNKATRHDVMQDVSLDDAALEKMFARQGFTKATTYGADDPAAYRRDWVKKRYRLQQDPATLAMTGKVPGLAYKQLKGAEPVYRDQVVHGERFGPQFWRTGQDIEKTAEDAWLPRLWRVVREKTAAERTTPFTIAVDLDGTLAESQDVHDPDKIGEPRQSVIDHCHRWKDLGARLIVWTVRGNTKLVREWLDKHDVPIELINENPDQPEGSSDKILADVYFDDRGVNVDEPHEVDRLLRKHDDPDEAEPIVVLERTIHLRVLLDPSDVDDELLEEGETDDRDETRDDDRGGRQAAGQEAA